MAIQLSVNLNKIALLRNSREGDFPNVETYGKLALDAGANGLTVHPRPDQRHIRPEDTRSLAELVKAYPGTEFNIEGNPTAPASGSYPGLIELVRESQPDQCTFVPDSDGQKTSDHGFDLKKDAELVAPLIQQVQNLGVRVSLFMDPDLEQIQLAKDIGADRIELYTGPFAWAFEQSEAEGQAVFQVHSEAAAFAQSIGLGINAGHDLNLENMVLYKNLPGLQEVSIGHALTVDALNMGFTPAVQAYKKVCS
ncbi:pyridoxine 5'-phosphate synthase [Teredinibacter sp. KSP-S5-2]|uniref:pyridoxine 5'-phosphate synthase n=1 Tax=Teredinibacter sp. KSP-S5-2 TaxID=3034506 RepID=UPI0029351945|nr:pyridoxine 5'-phosphate synthase [Teredinibacter sp. KSP-S5-2]WNO11011.1 pyridoxine 5'-phosphate synthase [Teredinibacter sp. KSP-S5-2]